MAKQSPKDPSGHSSCSSYREFNLGQDGNSKDEQTSGDSLQFANLFSKFLPSGQTSRSMGEQRDGKEYPGHSARQEIQLGHTSKDTNSCNTSKDTDSWNSQLASTGSSNSCKSQLANTGSSNSCNSQLYLNQPIPEELSMSTSQEPNVSFPLLLMPKISKYSPLLRYPPCIENFYKEFLNKWQEIEVGQQECQSSLAEMDCQVHMALANGGYKLIKKIGRGTFADVFLSDHPENQCKVAIKLTDSSKCDKLYAGKYLPREALIAPQLKHPNVIRCDGVYRVNWFYVFVMEYANGGTLARMLEDYRLLNNDVASYLFYQICLGIQYCHDVGISHRDIKTDNILLTKDLQVKISDFGFVGIISRSRTTTWCTSLVGTTPFSCPQVLGKMIYDPVAADAWSLGVILFFMVTGFLPFSDQMPLDQMISMQINKRWTFPMEIRIEPNCRIIIRRFLEPDPKKRLTIPEALDHAWFTKLLEEVKVV